MSIPDDSFHYYVNGGRLWPQKRCAANIFLLYSVLIGTPIDLLARNLSALLHSDPSKRQLARLQNVANRLHMLAGIPVAASSHQLLKEWQAAKSYAARTIVSFCSDSEFQIYQKDTDNFATDVFARLVSDFVLNLPPYESDHLKACVFSAYSSLKSERRLSGLYRLTFFSQAAIDAIRSTPPFLDLISGVEVDDLLDRKELYRRSILVRLGLSIRRQIVREVSGVRSTDWLTTGFFAE